MPFLRDFFTQMNELLAQQSTTKKALAAVILLAALGFGVVQMLKYGKAVDYEVLYAGLDAQTAKTLSDNLKTNAPGISFQVSQDDRGWTIKVPAARVLDLRLDLAPTIETGSGKVGWELFDKSTIGITDFTQKINRQRATQGELSRTIQSLEAVKTANVTLAIPEESIFVRDETQPKASVLIELRPKATLSKNRVEAIQALVAGSIEGLTKDNVTVVDTSGKLFSRPKGEENDKEMELDERARLVDQQEKQRKEYEHYLEEKITSALANVFGPDHVTAQVNVDFDFTVREMSELKYNPKNVPVSESTSINTAAKESVGAQGVAGSPAHLPPEGMSTSSVTQASSPVTSEERIINYNVGKTETKTLFPPYQIQRITASVLVDDMPMEKRDAKGSVTERTRQKLTEDQLVALEDNIKQIINFREERPSGQGDVVKVTNMTFRMPEELTPEETVTKIQTQRLIVTIVKYALLALAALLLVIFFVRPLMNIIAPRPALQPALAGPAGGHETLLLGPTSEEHALLESSSEPAALPGQELQGALPEPQGVVSDEILAKQAELNAEILALAKENPKKVSLVLRSWIDS